jgi:hypothetical protein
MGVFALGDSSYYIFQTAADVDGQRGHVTGTLVEGKLVRSVAAAE